MKIQEKIEKHRKINKESIQDLCALTGISRATYWRFIKGSDKISLENIILITKHLRLRILLIEED